MLGRRRAAAARRTAAGCATGDLSAVAVPPTIQALLAARLDRLAGERAAVIERGSVVGRGVLRGAVAELAPDGLRTERRPHLLALVAQGADPARAVRRSPGEDAFRFRHILIRDAAYDGMPKEARADLHERFAAWLERARGDRRVRGDLGYHLHAKGPSGPGPGWRPHRWPRHTRRRAPRSGRTEGARARRGSRLYQQAFVPAGQPGREPSRPVRVLALPRTGHVRAWRVCNRGYPRSTARRLRPRLAATRGWHGARGWRHWTPASLQTIPGAVAEAPSSIERAIGVFERIDDHAGLAKAWSRLGTVRWIEMRAGEAAAMIERSIQYARLAADCRIEAEGLGMLSTTALWGPAPVAEALKVCDEDLGAG